MQSSHKFVQDIQKILKRDLTRKIFSWCCELLKEENNILLLILGHISESTAGSEQLNRMLKRTAKQADRCQENLAKELDEARE